MMSNWEKLRLGDIISLKGGFSYKGNFVGSGDAFLVGMGSVSHSERFLLSGTRKYSGEFPDTHRLIPGDLVIATRQQSDNLPILGFPAMVPQALKGRNIILATNLYKVVNESEIDNHFLFWLLRGQEYQRHILSRAKGTTVRMLTKDAVENFEFYCPPKTEREKITSILDTFDNKIELNSQINQTLEHIAQAIFKSWFVDFEPVKAKIQAKAEGRDSERAAMCAISGKSDEDLDSLSEKQYQELAATATLFPNELVDSELGKIPEGWTISTIGEEVDVVGGGTPSTKNAEYWEGGEFHWTTPRDLSNLSSKVLLNTERKISKSGLDTISSGLLPVDTVLMSSRAPVGYLALAKVTTAVNQGFIALKCSKTLPPEFVLLWAMSVMDEIKQRASGSTFAEINKQTFRPMQIVVPKAQIVKPFSTIVKPIYDKIAESAAESRALSILRDTLLPKLLLGDIRATQEEMHANVISLASEKVSKKTTDEFVESVLIAQLVRKLSSPDYPLGRMRYNKLAYLVHRKIKHDVTERYKKKAAGPYSPWAKYQGPEAIALKNRYVKRVKVGKFEGLVVGEKIGKIDKYLLKYNIASTTEWVVNLFRYRSNDDLELLTTVDFAAIDLSGQGQAVILEGIKRVIATNKEWAPKLNRSVFSDENIVRALAELEQLFPDAYAK